MAETTAPAACTEQEYELACAAGLLVVTTGEEAAIHKFAESIRDQAITACRLLLDKREEALSCENSCQDGEGWSEASTYNSAIRRCIKEIANGGHA